MIKIYITFYSTINTSQCELSNVCVNNLLEIFAICHVNIAGHFRFHVHTHSRLLISNIMDKNYCLLNPCTFSRSVGDTMIGVCC